MKGHSYVWSTRQPIENRNGVSTIAGRDTLVVALLQSDGITTADLAVLQHRGIDPHISSVVLGCCAQDTCVLREIALRECSHYASGTGTSNAQGR